MCESPEKQGCLTSRMVSPLFYYAEVRCATKAYGSLVVCLCVCVCVCVCVCSRDSSSPDGIQVKLNASMYLKPHSFGFKLTRILR